MRKKLVCSSFGTIYYATLLKNGKMSPNGRIDMTDEAIDAVLYHLLSMDSFEESGFAGYDIDKKSGGTVRICVYDKDKYKLEHKEVANEVV